MLYSIDYQFIIKEDKPGAARWKGCRGQGMGEGHNAPRPFQSLPPPPSAFHVLQTRSSLNPVVWGFLWRLLYGRVIDEILAVGEDVSLQSDEADRLDPVVMVGSPGSQPPA